MSNFKNDLEAGQKVECEVAEIFMKEGYNVIFNDSKDITELGGWDLQVSKGTTQFKVEVKNDIMSSKTLNVAIEINCLERTKSEVWVFKLDGAYWAVNLKTLWDFPGRMVWGGDGLRSQLKLVPMDTFKNRARQLNTLKIN